jgi:hypothetical protein
MLIASRTFRLIGTAALAATLAGCGSGGSSGPQSPEGPGNLSFLYCRVVEQGGLMHIQWAAEVPTQGEIRYGRTSYSNLVNVPQPALDHDVTLFGLEYNTHYLFRVTITDSLDRSAQTAGDFTTPLKATPEPIISGFEINSVTETSADLHWYTDEPATTILYYGPVGLTDSAVNSELEMEHQVVLVSLLPSTPYLLKPEAVDDTGLRGYGRDTSLVTLARMVLWFPDTTVGLGDTVRLPIIVTNVQDLAALRLGIGFQPGSVEVIAVDEGPFYADNHGFMFFSTIRNSSGELYADLTWAIEFSGDLRIGTEADGGGVVAYAKLRGLETGPVSAVFLPDSCFGLDMYATARTCSLRAGIINVGP